MSSFLPDKLLDFEYYRGKLPLYLRESDAFAQHFKLWYDLIVSGDVDTGLAKCADKILDLIDIFNPQYLYMIAAMEGSQVTDESPFGEKSDILDQLGKLFGVSRNFNLVYNGTKYGMMLDNREFLMLIKTQIVQSYCDGTYEQINAFYKDIGLPCLVMTSTQPAQCKVYLMTDGHPSEYSNAIELMFRAGLLTIHSVGISYSYDVTSSATALMWDTASSIWDGGNWVL